FRGTSTLQLRRCRVSQPKQRTGQPTPAMKAFFEQLPGRSANWYTLRLPEFRSTPTTHRPMCKVGRARIAPLAPARYGSSCTTGLPKAGLVEERRGES